MSPSALLDAAAGLAEAGTASDALARILLAIRRATPADAAAVLALSGDGALRVASQQGLAPAAESRPFRRAEHPRLDRAIQAAGPIRFSDPALPDPYDGLLLGGHSPSSPIHACLAAPLYIERQLVGVLTMDALDPRGLDGILDDDVRVLAAITAAALRAGSAAAPAVVTFPKDAEAPRPEILGRSRAMDQLRGEIDLLGPTPTTVLVTGETGTGKELVVRALHARSARSRRPLAVVDCAALPAHLVEAELFGHTRGAFTGAVAARGGRFGAADGGTLFLDEVGELPLAAQAQLLRALQEGEIQRVGEDRPLRVDVRVLAATNRDLWREVREGRFRADLLHRLWVYPLRVPPLRERAGDVPLLAAHFARASAIALGRRGAALHDDALAALEGYPWPGNVRELQHAVERAILRRAALSRERPDALLVLLPGDLDPGAPASAPAAIERAPAAIEPLGPALDRARREAFERAFRAAGGNAAEVARLLGLSRSFAYKEAVRLGLIAGPPRRVRPRRA